MLTTPNIQNWTYSHNPAVSELDAVRFNIGDTNSDAKLLDDNEILYTLVLEGNVRQASIACLQNLITVYARQVDKSSDKKSQSLSQRVESFQTALDRLLERQSMSALNIFAGGQSRAGKDTQRANTDRVRPAFSKDMMDNPRAIQPNAERGSQEGDP